jgi:hypothetical protein
MDEDSHRRLGVFQALGDLRWSGRLYHYEEDVHDTIRCWFNENLLKPTRFTKAKRPLHRKQNKAVCWFKDSAHQHLDRIWDFVVLLEHHEVSVQMLKAEKVGYVVYEDEYQVAAEPFADTRC